MKKLYFTSQDTSVELLGLWKKKGNLITNPDYQRDYVYSEEKASRLIESALMMIPLHTLYLCEEGDKKYSVIDGQQRIMSFLKFCNGDFALKGLTTLTELNGKKYVDLDEELQGIIDSTSFRTITVSKESAEAKYDIFERLNRGAVTLKEQELRNCVYRGPYNSMINELATKKEVESMFKSKNNRMWYQEIILRFFALRNWGEYKPSMKKHLNKYLGLHQFDETIVDSDKEQFMRTLKTVREVLGSDAFATVDYEKKTVMNKFSATFFDAIMIAFSNFDRVKLVMNSDAIRKAINNKKLYDDEFHDACYAATGSRDRVIRRIVTIHNLIDGILGKGSMEEEKRIFDSKLKVSLAEKQNYVCPLCGNKIISLEDCDIDHILPYSLGGTTDESNAQLVHHHCNLNKSNHINLDEVLSSLGASDAYVLSDENTSLTGKKITMFKFGDKTHLVKKNFEFLYRLLDDLNEIQPGKLSELADSQYAPTKRSKPYICHSKEGMYNPYEVESGTFVECCMDNDKLMWFARKLFDIFNLNPDSVVVTLRGNEEDEETEME